MKYFDSKPTPEQILRPLSAEAYNLISDAMAQFKHDFSEDKIANLISTAGMFFASNLALPKVEVGKKICLLWKQRAANRR